MQCIFAIVRVLERNRGNRCGSFCSGIFTKADNGGTTEHSGRIFRKAAAAGGRRNSGNDSGDSAAEDEYTVIEYSDRTR